MTFKEESLKLWGSGSDTVYRLSGDLDSVTFVEGVNYASMTDERDGKVYRTVEIGEQIWMAENLNYGAYINDSSSSSFYQRDSQKFCYENESINCDEGGGLYQWHLAMGFGKDCGNSSKECSTLLSAGDHKGICPNGWHMPKYSEWEVLSINLGGTSVAGGKMKLRKNVLSNWDTDNFNDGNSSGFSALAVGRRYWYGGGFLFQGWRATFWEAEEYNRSDGYSRSIHDTETRLTRGDLPKIYGFSVRCLMNNL